MITSGGRGRTSVVRHDFDQRLFDMMRARVAVDSPDRREILGQYAREGRRVGWTWQLIAQAMQVGVPTVHRYVEASRTADAERAAQR